MLVVLINDTSLGVIVCFLCFNSKCVYVRNATASSGSSGAGSEHLSQNLHKTNMAAAKTCVPSQWDCGERY